jgi:hypothetical protein
MSVVPGICLVSIGLPTDFSRCRSRDRGETMTNRTRNATGCCRPAAKRTGLGWFLGVAGFLLALPHMALAGVPVELTQQNLSEYLPRLRSRENRKVDVVIRTPIVLGSDSETWFTRDLRFAGEGRVELGSCSLTLRVHGLLLSESGAAVFLSFATPVAAPGPDGSAGAVGITPPQPGAAGGNGGGGGSGQAGQPGRSSGDLTLFLLNPPSGFVVSLVGQTGGSGGRGGPGGAGATGQGGEPGRSGLFGCERGGQRGGPGGSGGRGGDGGAGGPCGNGGTLVIVAPARFHAEIKKALSLVETAALAGEPGAGGPGGRGGDGGPGGRGSGFCGGSGPGSRGPDGPPGNRAQAVPASSCKPPKLELREK